LGRLWIRHPVQFFFSPAQQMHHPGLLALRLNAFEMDVQTAQDLIDIPSVGQIQEHPCGIEVGWLGFERRLRGRFGLGFGSFTE
jgi:hypothetical protein